MKKALFFTHRNPQGYRIQQYFPFLEARGFTVELLTTETGFLDALERIRGADVLYVQRLLLSPLKLPLVRKYAKRIVYDFDDAVFCGAKGESRTRRAKFRRMVRAADATFCGNAFLLAEAKRYRQDGLYYVPTVVDMAEYPVKAHGSHGRPVAGWMGSSSTLPYIEDMGGLMRSLAESGRCAFEIVADRPPDMDIPGLTFKKWEKEKEKALLLDFDLGLMPLRDDVWSRGKCGLKLVQYMASGLPSIAHPVGVANEMIEDGVNGYLRTTQDEWRSAIEDLAGDAVMRARMGRAARDVAETRYALHVWGPKVAEIMDSL